MSFRSWTQQPLFRPPMVWRAPEMSTLPSWKGVRRIALDIETCDPQLMELGPGVRRGATITGVSFAIEDGPKHYLPIAHQGGGNLPRDAVLGYVRDNVRAFRGEVVGARIGGYDLDFLAHIGIEFDRSVRFLDVQIAAALIDERHDSYSLDAILKREGMPGKTMGVLREAADAYRLDNPRANLWRLPAAYVGEYAEDDADLPLKLMRRLERQLTDLELEGVWNLECWVVPALLAMTRRGVRVDLARLDQTDRWAEQEIATALADLRATCGARLDESELWSAEPVARALGRAGIQVPRTKTGKPQVRAPFLGQLKSPAAEAIVRARRMSKLRGTFVAGLRAHLIGDRVHPVYSQTRESRGEDIDGESDENSGTRTGRLSCSHPNIQQQPARNPTIGKRWRSIFVPDGDHWFKCDYRQQEPRLLVHYGDLLGLPKAHEAAQRYRDNPDTDSHQAMAEIAKCPRDVAKVLFLALCYGQGSGSMCRQLGLPTKRIKSARTGEVRVVAGDEGQRIIDAFDRMVPFARELAKRCEARAKEVGFIRTLSGRIRRFTEDGAGGWQDAYKACNSLIQGGSADQTKAAMAVAFEENLPVNMQVHDELNGSSSRLQDGHEIARVMREAVRLRIPSAVQLEAGPSWGEVTKI